MTINLNNVALICSDKFVSIKASFNLEDGSGTLYTWVVTKEFAADLVVGEIVAARKANGDIVLVMVKEVDEDCDIDLDASWTYHFAFAKVDVSALVDLEHDLGEYVKMLNKRRRDSIRQSVVARAMKEINGDVSEG